MTDTGYVNVGYDASALVNPDKGGGKGKQLLTLLGSHANEFVGFAPLGLEVRGLRLRRRGRLRYVLWQQISLCSMIREGRTAVFVAPYNTAPLFLPADTHLILVLHDLIPLDRYPTGSWRLRALLALWRFQIPKAVRRADLILTVSWYSRQEIIKRFPDARVRIIPCTLSEQWFDASKIIPISKRERYVLLITSIEPHRNLQRALRAFGKYSTRTGARSMKLKIAGVSRHIKDVQAMLDTFGLHDLATIEPYQSDDLMQDLVRRASAVLMPSLKEGFGIPILEGMATGTPVICSNRSSMPEVGGSAVEMFDPTDVDSIAAALHDVLSSATRREAMAAEGLRQAQQFHPRSVRELVESFWNSVFDEHGRFNVDI